MGPMKEGNYCNGSIDNVNLKHLHVHTNLLTYFFYCLDISRRGGVYIGLGSGGVWAYFGGVFWAVWTHSSSPSVCGFMRSNEVVCLPFDSGIHASASVLFVFSVVCAEAMQLF